MRLIKIGDDRFGIDPHKTRMSYNPPKLDMEIVGDPEIFERLHATARWSWALYPPKFYLLGSIVPVNARTLKIDVSGLDCALYMMEHNDVWDVEVTIDPAVLTVSGWVDLLGHSTSFLIQVPPDPGPGGPSHNSM